MDRQSPVCVHSVHRRSAQPYMLGFRPTWRSPFIGINRVEASAEENVPYGKINVRPRSSSDVKSNPKQTQRSNMGSIPGKPRPQRGGVNCNGQRLRVDKMANIRHGFGREYLLGFYGEHNSKNRKGSCRDVTSDS